MSEDDLRRWKAAFTVLDKTGTGYVTDEDFKVLLRGLRENPTETELEGYLKTESKEGKVGFPGVVNVMKKRQAEIKENEDELRESFKVFDKDGQGTCSTAELRHVLTNLGEKLSASEMDALIKLVDGDEEGQTNYVKIMEIFQSNQKYSIPA